MLVTSVSRSVILALLKFRGQAVHRGDGPRLIVCVTVVFSVIERPHKFCRCVAEMERDRFRSVFVSICSGAPIGGVDGVALWRDC